MNPFYDATPTSLSCLDERDYQAARNHWFRFGDASFVQKLGRKWMVGGAVKAGGLFKTQKAAEAYVAAQFLGEARWRKFQEYEAGAAG